jgi:hypothetical protein
MAQSVYYLNMPSKASGISVSAAFGDALLCTIPERSPDGWLVIIYMPSPNAMIDPIVTRRMIDAAERELGCVIGWKIKEAT